jgi:hypothetical protein
MLNESLDDVSNGDVSINTNIKVFKGGLGLVNKGGKKVGKKILEKDKVKLKETEKPQVIVGQGQGQIDHNDILSFRSKKEQFTLSNDHREAGNRQLDSNILKKHICEKLNTNKPKKANGDEKEIIKKIFQKGNEEKELKVFEIISDKYRSSSEYHSSDDEIESQKVEIVNLNEEERNIFWNLKSNIYDESSESQRKRCKSVSAAKLCNNTSSTNNSFHNNSSASKIVSKVTGTFSMLDKGKAVFVSSDDYIFVLPALFIPQNLVVGNSYMFKIYEIDKLNNRMNNINESIQKKYLKFSNL